MAEDKTPGVVDISKANFYNQSPEEQEKLLSSLEDSQKALEQRYANPNWYNIAAAFAKPQLGGFMASLGSANQVMGDYQEKQRANELTVAQQRAQIALMKNQMSQTAKGAALAKEGVNNPGKTTPASVADISNYSPTYGATAQGQLTNEDIQRSALLNQRASGMSEAELKAKNGDTFNSLFPKGMPALPNIPGAATLDTKENSENSKVPPESGMTQAEWDSKPLSFRNAFIAGLAESNKNVAVGSMQNYQKAAESALPNLIRYQGMRELATSPGMASVFNILGGNDVISLGGKALDEGRLTDRLANIQELLTQANITDPDLRRRAAELVKLVNENKSNIPDSSGRTTDQATALRGAANPSMKNPQTAFVALTDALAHTEAKNRDLFALAKSKKADGSGYNASNLVNEPAYKDFTKNFANEHSNILLNSPKDKTPSFYFSSKEPEKPTQNTPAPKRSAPSGWQKMPDGSFEEIK